VGLNGIRMSGSSNIDSFSSNNGPYSAGAATANASVGSNGNITLSGNAGVRGDARPGIGKATSGGSVTGSTVQLTSPLTEPAASAGSYTTVNDDSNVTPYVKNGGFSLSGGQTAIMPAGAYYFTSFSMSGGSSLTLLGPVTIYVAGTVSLSGSVTTNNSVPANLSIQETTSASVTLSGSTNYYVDLYAPQSRVSLTGSAQLMGSVVAQFLTLSGSSSVHMDQSLSSGSGRGISLVQ